MSDLCNTLENNHLMPLSVAVNTACVEQLLEDKITESSARLEQLLEAKLKEMLESMNPGGGQIGTRWWSSEPLPWVAGSLFTVTHNLNMTQAEQEQFQIRCDAKVTVPVHGWSVGDVVRDTHPYNSGTSAYPATILIVSTTPNSFTATWPGYAFFTGLKGGSTTALGVRPANSNIILRIRW